jgi:hypothetical protein
MTWLEIGLWSLAFSIATSLFYRKGVRAGIRHALMTLDLDAYQTEILNNELKKDSYDVAMTAGKEYSKNETLLN